MSKFRREEDEADKWLREHDPYYTSSDRDKRKKMSNPYETPEQEKRRRETEIPLSNLNSYQRVQFKQVELSNWDDELLKKELFELQAVDYSLEVMGFTEIDLKEIFTEKEVPKEKKKKEEKTTLPMLRFGSNSVRITEDELVMLSNRYNEYVESTPDPALYRSL